MFQRFHLLRLFLGSAPTSHFTAPSPPRETSTSHIYVGISQTNNDGLPAATRRRRSDERPDGECVRHSSRHDCCWHLRVISHSEARFPLSDPLSGHQFLWCLCLCVSLCVCVRSDGTAVFRNSSTSHCSFLSSCYFQPFNPLCLLSLPPFQFHCVNSSLWLPCVVAVHAQPLDALKGKTRGELF